LVCSRGETNMELGVISDQMINIGVGVIGIIIAVVAVVGIWFIIKNQNKYTIGVD